MVTSRTYTAFAGPLCISTGPLSAVLLEAKRRLVVGSREPVLFFEDDTGKQVDFDLRGTDDEVLDRVRPAPSSPRPGRPKLGVVSREVSLLPRHWEWLASQPNGISAALRRLVEEARRRQPQEESARLALEATSRAMTALAGDLPGYEEASRALFARDARRFDELLQRWPADVRAYLLRLASSALAPEAAAAILPP